MSHTKGEWKIGLEPQVVISGGKVICRTGYKNPASKGAIEELANARLIAAAPELLEACKQALICLTYDSDMEEDFAHEIKLLRKAIKQAEEG